MAIRRPIVANNGELEVLQAGDTLPGGGGAGVLPCFTRTLSANLTIGIDEVCLTHDIVIGAGVTLTILTTGELLNL